MRSLNSIKYKNTMRLSALEFKSLVPVQWIERITNDGQLYSSR